MNTKIKKITTIGMLCAMTYVIMAVGKNTGRAISEI